MSVQPVYDADLATIAALAERFKRALALTNDEVATYLAQLEAWVKETTAFACFTAQRRFAEWCVSNGGGDIGQVHRKLNMSGNETAPGIAPFEYARQLVAWADAVMCQSGAVQIEAFVDVVNDPLYHRPNQLEEVLNGENFQFILKAMHEVVVASSPDRLARSSYHFLKQTLGMTNNGQLLADLKAEAPYEDDEGDESAAPRRASIDDHERQQRTSKDRQ
ncbi:hypothetical protein M885DRAFT_581296 [Pelagophyceae sp. CCMP2097]|nr:hypothetical protein M885DRAFT_581296 [Pelagophyceae sp. CCMP2097]